LGDLGVRSGGGFAELLNGPSRIALSDQDARQIQMRSSEAGFQPNCL
jgi:hypothetical protein